MLQRPIPNIDPAPERFRPVCNVCSTTSTPVWRSDELYSPLCNICYLRRFVMNTPPAGPKPMAKEQKESIDRNRVAAEKMRERKRQWMGESSSNETPTALPKATKLEESPRPSACTPQEEPRQGAETPNPVYAQKTEEIFDGLDAIDWSTLKSCYGTAPDIPKWLRALRSPSDSIRQEVFRELQNNTLHQGTRYEPSVATVPFLLKLIADKETAERESIVYFLVDLAIGNPEDLQPRRLNVTALREQESHWRDADINEMLKNEDNSNPGTYGGLKGRMLEDERSGILSGMDCYDAVRAGVPTFLSLLLGEEDAAVRVASAYAVAWFPEDANSGHNAILPALTGLIESNESHPSILASTILAAGSLISASAYLMDSKKEEDDPKAVRLFQERLAKEDEAFAIRWAAAKALIELEKENSEAVLFMANSLLKAHNGGGLDTDIKPFGADDLYGGSLLALKDYLRRNQGNSVAIEVVQTLVGELSQLSGVAALFFADLCLTMVFHASRPPPHPVLPSFDQLDEKQQIVARTLADMGDEIWEDMWFSGACRQRGLPGSRTDCRKYVQTNS